MSKEQLRTLIDLIMKKTGQNQEQLAISMNYKKSYISEVLSPSGSISGKFLDKLRLTYGEIYDNRNNEMEWAKLNNSKDVQNKPKFYTTNQADRLIIENQIEVLSFQKVILSSIAEMRAPILKLPVRKLEDILLKMVDDEKVKIANEMKRKY